MNVLVACEFSGIVRDAFIARGHNAVSCDLLPTERPGPHLQGDIRMVLEKYRFMYDWDLLIAHPPCTYLSVVGNRSFNIEKYGIKALRRYDLRANAVKFVDWLYNQDIPRICLENPVGYLNKHWRKPTQIVQPFHFGDPHRKTTCLWLSGLPKLIATSNMRAPKPVGIRMVVRDGVRSVENVHFTESVQGGSKIKAHIRSKTFQGIADAMAQQWG